MIPIPNMISIKIVAVLALLLTASSALVYYQIKKNGEFRAVNTQLKEDLSGEVFKNIQLHAQRDKDEKLAAATIKNQHKIISSLNSQLTVYSNLERDNPDVKEYMDLPVPDALLVELRGEAD